MGEIKSVKVDNWGVFFLQKLQNFFNKTDYCDLTLQFDDNSQLKVHRLVLSACTDYFNVLEQTYEVNDDILIMPRELQADVVVPIVNFMYTGTLEFEINMYGRLLKTAKDMNMTVLLKLLEAHKRTVEVSRAQANKQNPTGGNNVHSQFIFQNTAPRSTLKNSYSSPKRIPSAVRTAVRPVERTYSASPNTSSSVQQHQNQQQQQPRRVHAQMKATQYKNIQIKPVNATGVYYRKPLPEPAAIVAKYPHSQTTVKGPSRFECADETILPPESFESSFDNISYESKPLITATQICKEERDLDDYEHMIPQHTSLNQSSPFEQLRRSYTSNSNKRPASSASSMGSPPDKKPNIQDVKEYAEQQRMRKQIAAEYDEDNEYDDVLDDEFHNDDDDDDYVPPASYQRQNNSQKYQPQKPVVIKQESDRKSMIVLKNSGPNTDHAKIISEVLKKYPHLVKKPDNVKFQIMTKSGKTSTQKVVIKEEPDTCKELAIAPAVVVQPVTKTKLLQQSTLQPSTSKSSNSQPPISHISTPPQPSTSKSSAPASTTSSIVQPKRIDSKTMHALIALGAENTTGPWLCLRCGINGRPISIPSYRGFRRHLINTHKEKIDPRLCEHCGWRSRDNRELAHHMLVQHSIKPSSAYSFPECEYCSEILLNEDALDQHVENSHPEYKKDDQQCMYCNKSFSNETLLYDHIRSKHKLRAEEDGIIDFSDNDDSSEDKYVTSEEQQLQQHAENNEKIKILSNITIPKNTPIIQSNETVPNTEINLEPSSEAEALNNVATGIATSLGLADNTTVIHDSHILSNEYINQEMDAIHSDFGKKMPKFVTSDGNVMELTQAQREEIISQLDDQHNSGVVMVLNQDNFETTDVSVPTTSVVTDQELTTDDSNMFIVYSQANESGVSKTNTSTVQSATLTATKTTKLTKLKKEGEQEPLHLEWPEESESQIFENQESKPDKQNRTRDEISAEESLGETEEQSTLNESEDNIEKVIREMDQGYSPQKTNSLDVDEKVKPKSGEQTKVVGERITKDKLKLLTGDWSDDEDDENEENEENDENDENDEDDDEDKAKAEQNDNAFRKSGTMQAEQSSKASGEEIVFETVAMVSSENPKENKGNIEKITEMEDKDKEIRSMQDDDERKAEQAEKGEESKAISDEVEESSNKSRPEIKKSKTEEKPNVDETIKCQDSKDKEISDKEDDDDDDDDNDDNVSEKSGDKIGNTSESKVNETKTAKNEIRNLISDWGDDDEDEM